MANNERSEKHVNIESSDERQVHQIDDLNDEQLEQLATNLDSQLNQVRQEYRDLVTLHTNLENQLEEKIKELQRALQDNRSFTYAASHTLKTPLRGISRLADWFVNDYPDEFGENISRVLKLVKYCKKIDALLDNLSEVAKIDQDKLAPHELHELSSLGISPNKLQQTPNMFPDDLKNHVFELSSELSRTRGYLESLQNLHTTQSDLLNKATNELKVAIEKNLDLVHGIAHGLTTELKKISDITNWLVPEYKDKLDQNGREQIKLLVERVQHLDPLYKALDNFARIGHVEKGNTRINLNTLVHDILNSIREFLIQKKRSKVAQIHFFTAAELPEIYADRLYMTELFQNLITNAIKAIHSEKVASFTDLYGLVKIDLTEDTNYWTFSIADDGPGIEPKHHEKIFGIFTKLQISSELGMGLTIAKRIVELYGGEISVKSDPKKKKGATFFFTLPKSLGVKKEGSNH